MRFICGPPGPATRDPPRHGEESRTLLAQGIQAPQDGLSANLAPALPRPPWHAPIPKYAHACIVSRMKASHGCKARACKSLRLWCARACSLRRQGCIHVPHHSPIAATPLPASPSSHVSESCKLTRQSHTLGNRRPRASSTWRIEAPYNCTLFWESGTPNMSPSREREEAGHAEIGNQLTCTRGSETDGGGRADQEVIPPLARCSLRCKHDDATRQIPVRIAAFSSPYLAPCQPVRQPCQSNRDPCQPVRDPCQPVRHPNLEEYGTPK